MDNVNVLRAGFFAPDFSLPDSSGQVFSLKENLKDNFLALCFFPANPEVKIKKYLTDLNSGLPVTSSGINVRPVGICPDKINILAGLKNELKLDFPVLSDQKFDVSRGYYLSDSSGLNLSVHFSIIVIDNDRIIRHRVSEHGGLSEFDPDKFRANISGLI
ncbi:MAG: redoxin domain-containing protein [candidate division Zixibacteria bacterium]